MDKWQTIDKAPVGRNNNNQMPLVLIIGRYPDRFGWSDIYQSWPDTRSSFGWARWPHTFPPTHFMISPEPPKE